MFCSEYLHRVDEKGRVIVPLKFREELGYRFFIAKSIDGCLTMYSQKEWKKIRKKMDAIPSYDKTTRFFARTLFSSASECEIDRQGRFLIPLKLRTYAGISKEAYMVGVGSKAEIWSKQAWEAYKSDDSITPEMIASKMAELGI